MAAAFFTALEVISVYLTNNLVDYRFYYHMNFDALAGDWSQFSEYFMLFPILFILIFFLLYRGSKEAGKLHLNKNRFFIPIVIAIVFVLSFPGGMLNEVYKLYGILGADKKSFNDALVDIGISPDIYIDPTELRAAKGSNIVVISIESLEQGFLSSNFNNITPNLNRLAKEWTFYNEMPPSPGGGWTAASLYNQQVGMPAFFKGQGNEIFQGAIGVQLTGLGHILKAAGYDSRYILGKKEFGGMSELLTAYGITSISEKNSIGTYLIGEQVYLILTFFEKQNCSYNRYKKGMYRSLFFYRQ